MKRKVIQIAGSTQLVSLPRQWAKAHNISRGQEIDVQEDGNKIIVSCDNLPSLQKAEVDITELGNMTHRIFGSYYRAGIDELKVNYDNPKLIEQVYDSLSRETMVGFEVLEHGDNYCVLKYVAGEMEEFNSVLRRVFMLLINMSAECSRLLKEKKFDVINNLSFLEKSNNRFTTICRRILNKSLTSSQYQAIGPLYFIVEGLENVADEYKYISQHYSKLTGKTVSIDREALATFEKASSAVKLFCEVFYKFDVKKLVELKGMRDSIVDEAHKIFQRKVSHIDIWLTHHSIMLVTLVFNMVGPFVVMLAKEKRFNI